MTRQTGVVYPALCPNRRGAERRRRRRGRAPRAHHGERDVNRRLGHIGRRDLDQVALITKVAHQAGVHIVIAIGVCMFCPTRVSAREPRSRADRAHAPDGIGGLPRDECAARRAAQGHGLFSMIRDPGPTCRSASTCATRTGSHSRSARRHGHRRDCLRELDLQNRRRHPHASRMAHSGTSRPRTSCRCSPNRASDGHRACRSC